MTSPPSTAARRSSPRLPWALLAILVLAALLQASRLPFRWNQIALAYAAYFHEFRHVIELNGWGSALTTFVGLHPPAYSLLFLGMMVSHAPAACWFGVSGLLSVAAGPLVWATARQHWGREAALGATLAALVLAISPHRNAYGLEVNNYPLLVAATAGQLLAFSRWVARPPASSRPSGAELLWIATTTLALWTHVLSIALPISQLALLLALPEGRARLRRFGLALAVVVLLCVPLLPGLLAGSGADPINAPAGILTALSAALAEYPGRYGSETAANLLGLLALLGAWTALQMPRNERLIPLSWLAHTALAATLIVALTAGGVAAAHQFPYYLVLLPGGALLVAKAACDGAGRLPVPTVVLRLCLATALGLHGLALTGAALQAGRTWNEADSERGLMALAVQAWQPGAALLLVNFPRGFDDDKDQVDPTYALIPMTERLTFAQPEVPTLVPGDPSWGQPFRFEGGRWLYTFTDFKETRVDAIADTTLAAGNRVILAVYDTQRGEREVEEIRAWALQRGEPGRRAPGQLMFVLDP